MGRKADNEIPFNYQAVDRRVREGKDKPQREWRIADVPGLVLVTYPSGSAAYFFFYRDKAAGKTRKYRIGDHVAESEAKRHKDAGQDPNAPPVLTLAEARRKAEEQRHAVQDGSDPVAVAKARANALTFQALAERFLTEARIAVTTRTSYREKLTKYVYPAIGHLPAVEVTPEHVLAICQTIEARRIVTIVDGQKVERSPRVQSQRTKSAIGGVYRWAKREGLGNVKTSPARDVAPRIGLTRRTRTPTDADLATYWAETESKANKLTPAMRLILQLAVLTAQRRTEVAGARKSELRDLDTDNPVWIIPGDETYRGIFIDGRTKNGREQTVYLSKQAAELFRQAVAISKDKECVFPADMRRQGR
jgi:integrase